MVNVAINGFGRIGRAVLKASLSRDDIKFVGINDLMDTKTLAHLLKYDSVYGQLGVDISHDEKHLIVNGNKIPVFCERNPRDLPWGDLDVDVVLECTGLFLTEEKSMPHIEAGAKMVILSAPAKDENVPTYLVGVNADAIDTSKKIISNASCTTNSIGMIMNILKETVGVEKSLMTTVHAYTAKQALLDGPNKDLRRGRSAAINMIPTTTGAAVATTKVLPELEGCFDGMAIRVPLVVGSLSDITLVSSKETSAEEINDIFKKAAANGKYKGIFGVNEEPLVSTDFLQSPYSATVDLPFTKVIKGDLCKILAWYDNEWGYSNRLIDLAAIAGKKLK